MKVTKLDLDLKLMPSCSLSPRGFWVVMAIAGAFSISVGLAFFINGAWPIAGFLGLDLALLYWALKASARLQRGRSEHIRLDKDALLVDRAYPGRKSQSYALQPAWVRVDLRHADEHHACLTVRDNATAVRLGEFLPPRERAQIAELIEAGLARRKARILAQ